MYEANGFRYMYVATYHMLPPVRSRARLSVEPKLACDRRLGFCLE